MHTEVWEPTFEGRNWCPKRLFSLPKVRELVEDENPLSKPSIFFMLVISKSGKWTLTGSSKGESPGRCVKMLLRGVVSRGCHWYVLNKALQVVPERKKQTTTWRALSVYFCQCFLEGKYILWYYVFDSKITYFKKHCQFNNGFKAKKEPMPHWTYVLNVSMSDFRKIKIWKLFMLSLWK